MKRVQLLLVFALMGLLCVTAQAEVTIAGFQGYFSDIDVSPQTQMTLTSGVTVGSDIDASFSDLEVDLLDFTANGDPVLVSPMILTGINGATGSATYTWDFANLTQFVWTPEHAMGSIAGELTLQSGYDLTTILSESILLPESLTVTISYNGVVVTTDGTNGSAMKYQFSLASARAVSNPPINVPEPSTIISLLAGLGVMLVVWRRRK